MKIIISFAIGFIVLFLLGGSAQVKACPSHDCPRPTITPSVSVTPFVTPTSVPCHNFNRPCSKGPTR